MESEIYFTWIFKSTGYLEKTSSDAKPILPINYRECLYKCQIYNEFGSKYLTNYPHNENFDEIFNYLTNHSGKVIENLSKHDRDDYINKLSNPNLFDKKRHVSLIKCFIKAYICELAPIDRIQCVLSSSINFDDSYVSKVDDKVTNNFLNIRKSLCSWLSNNSFKGLEKLHMKLNQSYSKTEWMNYINNFGDLGSLLIYTVKYCAQSRISDCKAHVPSTQNISSGKGLSPKERTENCQQLIQVFSELLPDNNDDDNNNMHDSSTCSPTVLTLPLSLEQLSKPVSLIKSCNSNTDSVLRTLCIALIFHYTAGVGLKKMASLLNTQISINSTNLLNNPLLNSVIADNNNNSNNYSSHTDDTKLPADKGGFFLDLKSNNNSDRAKMKKLFNLNSTTNHLPLNGEHNKTNDNNIDANSNSGSNSPPEIFLTPTEEFSFGFNQIPNSSTKLLSTGSNKVNIIKTIDKPPDVTELPSLKERYQQKKKENVGIPKKPVITIGNNETSWLAASNKTSKSSPLKKPVNKTQTNSPKKTTTAINNNDTINEADRQKLMLDLNSKRQQIIKQRKETDKSRHKIIETHKKEAFFNTLSGSNNSSRRNSHEEKSPEKTVLVKDNKANDLSVLDEELNESLVISNDNITREIDLDYKEPIIDIIIDDDNDSKSKEISNCIKSEERVIDSNDSKLKESSNCIEPEKPSDNLNDAKPSEILSENNDILREINSTEINDTKPQQHSTENPENINLENRNELVELKGDVIRKEPTFDEDDDDIDELENEFSPDSVNGSFTVESLELVEKPEDDIVEVKDILNVSVSNISTTNNTNNECDDINGDNLKALDNDDKSLVSSTLSSLTDDLDSDQSKHSANQQRPGVINLHEQLVEMDQQLSSSFVIPKPSSPITVLYNTDKTPTNKTKQPNLFISFDISGNNNDDENEDDNKSHSGSLSNSMSATHNSPNPSNQPIAFIIDESLSSEPNGKGDKEIDDARRLKADRLAKLEENRLKRLEKVKLNSERKKEQLQQKTYELERQKEEKKRQEKEKRNSAYVKFLESKEEVDHDSQKASLTHRRTSQLGASAQHLASVTASNTNISASVGGQAKLRPRSNTVVNTTHSPAQRNSNTSTLHKKNTNYASMRKNDRSTSASTSRLNSLVNDHNTNSSNFGKPLPVQDYTTPGGSTRLYKLPQSKSNRPVIINAINYCCLAGSVNEPNKQAVLKKLSETEGCHFMVLFRDTRCQYRALYSFCLSSEQLHLVTGHGPRVINHEMVDKFYKYSSGAKQFKLINSTKHLSPAIDGICIHAHLWSTNQTNSGSGNSARLNSALSTSRIFNKS